MAAIAAVIVLAVVAWLAVGFVRQRGTDRQPSAGEKPSAAYQASLLDLRNRAALRGAEENGNKAPVVLPAAPLDLSIYLPTGSKPGNYEIQVTQGPGQALLRTQEDAVLRDHIAVLQAKLDLEQLRPGLYLFWIRHGDSSCSYYPVRIQARP